MLTKTNDRIMAAWHEAGHFVARWICNLAPTGARIFEDENGCWIGRTDGSGEDIGLAAFLGAGMVFYSSAGLTSEMIAKRATVLAIGLTWTNLLKHGDSMPAGSDIAEILSPCLVDSLKVVFFRRFENETPIGLRHRICWAGAVLLRENWEKVKSAKELLLKDGEISEARAARLFSSFGSTEPSTTKALLKMRGILGPIDKDFARVFENGKNRRA